MIHIAYHLNHIVQCKFALQCNFAGVKPKYHEFVSNHFKYHEISNNTFLKIYDSDEK